MSSYSISNLEYSPFLTGNANDFLKNFVWVSPSKEMLSKLPLPLKPLETSPFSVRNIFAENFIDFIPDFPVRSDDVFVCSLPKCGSTWVETIVWLLKQGLNYENVDLNKRQRSLSAFESPNTLKKIAKDLFEKDASKSLTESAALKMAWSMHFENLESPRVIKNHLPMFSLPINVWASELTGPKVVYIARNLKDTIVSEYHFRRNYLPPAEITMDDVVNGIIKDIWIHSPYMEHILNAWSLRHLKNVLFIHYEDLVNDTFANVKRISEFLDCSYTDDQLNELVEYVSFDNMKKNDALNRENLITDAESTSGMKRLDPTFRYVYKSMNLFVFFFAVFMVSPSMWSFIYFSDSYEKAKWARIVMN